MKLKAHGASDVGRVRSENEDRYYCNAELGVFAVADGIGGKPGGQVASQTVVDGVAERAAEFRRFVDARSPALDDAARDEIFDYLFEELQSINYEVFQRGSSDKYPRGIGCTVDLVVMSPVGAFILHVGDSRVYLFRGDAIYRVTRDHTYAERLREQAGRAGREVDADVNQYAHVLTRSVGATPRVKVDRLFVGIEPDNHLLLCTDGITKYMASSDILEKYRQTDIDGLAGELIAEANECGGADNSTVVVVSVPREESEVFGRESTKPDTFRRVHFLQSIDLFEDLELQEMLKVLRHIYFLRCSADRLVVSRGDAVDGLYFVMSGSLSVELGGRKLGSLGPGEHFGEVGLFGEPVRSADVQCQEDCDILFLPRESLRTLVSEDPILGNKLLWRLLARTSKLIQRML